jgi:hypothetical protein
MQDSTTEQQQLQPNVFAFNTALSGRRLLDAIAKHDVGMVQRVLSAVPDEYRKDVVHSQLCVSESTADMMPIACVVAGQPCKPDTRAKIFDCLLRCGLDPNFQANGHETFLSLSCMHGDSNLPTVQLLLDSGADPNRFCGERRWNALFRTCTNLGKNFALFRALASTNKFNLRADLLGGDIQVSAARVVVDLNCDKHPDRVLEVLESLHGVGCGFPPNMGVHYTEKSLDARYGPQKEHARISQLLTMGSKKTKTTQQAEAL